MIQIGRIKPSYDLKELKTLLSKQETRHITHSGFQTAVAIGFASAQDMVDAVIQLDPSDFHKTMPSEKVKGTFQDVYKRNINGIDIYIKLSKSPQGNGVIVSFKRK